MTSVAIRGKVAKALRRAPRQVIDFFHAWVKEVEKDGIAIARANRVWRDHALKGNKSGRRSVCLGYSWRLEYVIVDGITEITLAIQSAVTHHANIADSDNVEVLEVHNHDY